MTKNLSYVNVINIQMSKTKGDTIHEKEDYKYDYESLLLSGSMLSYRLFFVCIVLSRRFMNG